MGGYSAHCQMPRKMCVFNIGKKGENKQDGGGKQELDGTVLRKMKRKKSDREERKRRIEEKERKKRKKT